MTEGGVIIINWVTFIFAKSFFDLMCIILVQNIDLRSALSMFMFMYFSRAAVTVLCRRLTEGFPKAS